MDKKLQDRICEEINSQKGKDVPFKEGSHGLKLSFFIENLLSDEQSRLLKESSNQENFQLNHREQVIIPGREGEIIELPFGSGTITYMGDGVTVYTNNKYFNEVFMEFSLPYSLNEDLK